MHLVCRLTNNKEEQFTLTSREGSEPVTTMENGNIKILLVDNEADIALAFKIGLEDSGFILDAFNYPFEALSNFKAGFYDLFLLISKCRT